MGKAKYPHNSKRPEPKGVIEAIEKNDLEALLRVLSVRQRRFAEEYVYDFDGKAAAIRAGYAIPFADRQAYILLKHRGVMYYIDHLSKKKETNITLVDENYIIQGIIRALNKAEEITNLTAALRALELLARHKGMLTDKQEITGKDGGAIEIAKKEAEKTADEFVDIINNLRSKGKPDLKVVGK
jgi:phage terminase small subunit